MARKPTGKRDRFEVFKRDGFACQYCGSKPPACILEVDHIVPVSKGGASDQINLITSCFDCNRGKADKTLSISAAPVAEQIEAHKAKRKQAAAYARFLTKIRKEQDEKVVEVGRYWYNYFMPEKNKWGFGRSRMVTVRRYLEQLTTFEIMDAMDIAFSNVGVSYEKDENAFRYFCGVCKNKIRGGF